jgi:hypothetical protein
MTFALGRPNPSSPQINAATPLASHQNPCCGLIPLTPVPPTRRGARKQPGMKRQRHPRNRAGNRPHPGLPRHSPAQGGPEARREVRPGAAKRGICGYPGFPYNNETPVSPWKTAIRRVILVMAAMEFIFEQLPAKRPRSPPLWPTPKVVASMSTACRRGGSRRKFPLKFLLPLPGNPVGFKGFYAHR